MRKSIDRFVLGCRSAILACLAWHVFLAPSIMGDEIEDDIEIVSVSTYQAESIVNGQAIGNFLHVHARVWMSAKTRARIHEIQAIPTIYMARLDIDDVHIFPCGEGGRLPRQFNTEPLEVGELMTPLFFVPKEYLGSELTLVGGIGSRHSGIEPVRRVKIPEFKLLSNIPGPIPATIVSKGIGKHVHYKSDLESLDLRLPEGFTQVLRAGTGKILRGGNLALYGGLSHGSHAVTVLFPLHTDAGGVAWELRFPAQGAKAELDVAFSTSKQHQPIE